jgi:hypothetical protein
VGHRSRSRIQLRLVADRRTLPGLGSANQRADDEPRCSAVATSDPAFPRGERRLVRRSCSSTAHVTIASGRCTHAARRMGGVLGPPHFRQIHHAPTESTGALDRANSRAHERIPKVPGRRGRLSRVAQDSRHSGADLVSAAGMTSATIRVRRGRLGVGRDGLSESVLELRRGLRSLTRVGRHWLGRTKDDLGIAPGERYQALYDDDPRNATSISHPRSAYPIITPGPR